MLIANRGEIALRIIRSARALGLQTVAVFSQPDAGMPHVAAADEACAIGPADAAASYLNIAAILAAAQRTGADAIHPGYGFLSERPDFARAVSQSGMLFVGPPAEAMARLGDKLGARRLAAEVGVPTVPGVDGADLASARAFAGQAGFPILVKAAAGGGGRGMRVVASASELEAALEAAEREAKAAFGDGRLLIEKYLARPRHVEVQLLGDEHGHLVALGDRDCSIQRRHQKILEESPAPELDQTTRTGIAEAALRLFHAAGYRNAGTAEFLVDSGNFYFLEANTRLQVEHPVTEMRFGCDLVAEQLRIAAGGPIEQPPAPRGHAIECRVYAEDAERDFRPAAGRVRYLNLPAGPGVRVDSHLAPGLEVSSYYDGLLAKIVCWGETRAQAAARAGTALGEFSLLGLHHTAALLSDVVTSEPFRRAELSTGFLAQFFAGWHPPAPALEAAAAAVLMFGNDASSESRPAGGEQERPGARSPWERLASFELWGRR